jgi:hypothetical protein
MKLYSLESQFTRSPKYSSTHQKLQGSGEELTRVGEEPVDRKFIL